MCKYKKDNPQPKNLHYPRVAFTSECGFRLILNEGYDTDWKNPETHGKLIKPRGNCMKCNTEIEVIELNKLK